MNPGDFGRDVFIFVTVAGCRVVFHFLPRAAAALSVYLEEDDVAVFGDTDPVEGQVAVDFRSDRAADDGLRDGADWCLRLRF